jgi:hypothetical protein
VAPARPLRSARREAIRLDPDTLERFGPAVGDFLKD